MRKSLDNYLNSCTKLTPEQAEMALIIMLNSGKWEGVGNYPTEQQLMEVFTPKPITLDSAEAIESYINACKTGIIDPSVLPKGSVNEITGKNGEKITLLAKAVSTDESTQKTINEALFYGNSELGKQARHPYLKKDAITNHVLEDAVIDNGVVKIQLKEKGTVRTIKVLPDEFGSNDAKLLDADTGTIITDQAYKEVQKYFKDIYKNNDLDASFAELTGIPHPSKFSTDFVKSPDTDIQKAKTNIRTEIVKYRNNDGVLTPEGKKLYTQLFDPEVLPDGTTNAILDNGTLVLNIHRRDNSTGDLTDFKAFVDLTSSTPKIRLTLNGKPVEASSSNHMEITAMIKNKLSGIEGSVIDHLAEHGVRFNDDLKKPMDVLDTIKAIMQKQQIDLEKSEVNSEKLAKGIYTKLPENYEYQTMSDIQDIFPRSENSNNENKSIKQGESDVSDIKSDRVDKFEIVRADIDHTDALKPYSHKSRYFVKYQGRYFDVTKAVSDIKDGGNPTIESLRGAIVSEVNSAIHNYRESVELSNQDIKKEHDSKTLNDLHELDDVENFNDPETSQKVLNSKNTILSNEELKYWNSQGVGENPRILVGSERSDPAFHVQEIIDVLEGKKTVKAYSVKDGKRVATDITGKDFAGLYLITKHDGLPMLKLLQTKIPKLIHFSITGLGGTKYEPGVMKYNDFLDKIQDYIHQGLDPEAVTIRIDPIIPELTKFEDIENIVKRSAAMGIKRIRFSIMDAYSNTRKAMTDLGYPVDTYYNGFNPKADYVDKIATFMLSLKEKYGITLGTCSEKLVRKGISKEGCLSVSAVNKMLGTSIEDKGEDNNTQRKLCSCYGGKVDALQYSNNCASHCIYCYAKHENDKALDYYNEDGSLKNNKFTQTRDESNNTFSKKTTEEDISTIKPQNSNMQYRTTDGQTKEMKVNAASEGSYFHKESFDENVTDIGYEGNNNEVFFMEYKNPDTGVEYKVAFDITKDSEQDIVYVREETTGEWREAKPAELPESLYDYLTSGLIKNPQAGDFMHTEKGLSNNFQNKQILREFVKYGLGYTPTEKQLADFQAKEELRKSNIQKQWSEEHSATSKTDLSSEKVDFTTLTDVKARIQTEGLGETSVEIQYQLLLCEKMIAQSADALSAILPSDDIYDILQHIEYGDTDYFNNLLDSSNPKYSLLNMWVSNIRDYAMKQAISDIVRSSPEMLKALQDSGDSTISFNAKDNDPASQKTKELDNLSKVLTEIRADLKAFNTEGKYITIKSSGAGFAGAKALQMAKNTGYGFGGLANKGFSHTIYRDMQNNQHVHGEDITGYGLKEDLDTADNDKMLELLFPDEDIKEYVLSQGQLGDVTVSQWITMAKNILDSDCSILYTDSMIGKTNIEDALRTIGKPVLINPTSSEQIATFIAMNNAKIVNVDGPWEIGADMQKAMEKGINQANTLFDKQMKGSLIQDPEVRKQYFKMQGLDTLLSTEYKDYDDNSFKITKTELQDLGNALADKVSEMLDAIEGKDFSDSEVVEAFKAEFPEVLPKDTPMETIQKLGGLDRLRIVRQLGPENIVKGLKAWMDSSDADVMSIMVEDLKANMGSLLMLSQQRLAESEGFILQDSNMDPLKKVEKQKSDDVSEDNGYENDSDYVLELEGDSLEHWQVEQRSVDLMDAVDNLVKRELRNLRLKDAEGNDETHSSWGTPIRVDDRMALNSIVYWCQGQTRLSGMVEVLKAKSDKATWLTPLIEKLDSPEGQYENLKSKFFSGVFSSKQLYSSVAVSGDHYYHRVLNQCPELTTIMGRLTAMSTQGELSIIAQNGRFKNDSYKKLKDLRTKLGYRDLDMDRIAQDRTPEQLANARYHASEIVKMFDVDIPKEIFDRLDGQTLDKIGSALDKLFTTYEKTLKKADSRTISLPSMVNMFKFRTSDGKFNPLCLKYQIQEVLQPIAEEMECANKSVVYNGGKTYQTYTTPSYLSKVFSQFQNPELGKRFIEDNYMNDQFLTLKVGNDNRKPIWWLKNLEVASKEGLYQHTVQLDVDGSQYMKNQTEAEHMMGVLTAFGEQLNNLEASATQKYGWFQIPIMSNKPSNDYVKMPVFDTDTVINNLFENFLQECSRIQTVTMRKKNKGEQGFLKNWDTKGKEFNFLAFLEPYRTGKQKEISYKEGYGPEEQTTTVDLHKLITDHLEGKDVELRELEMGVKEAIKQHLDAEYELLQKQLENNGVKPILEKQWPKDTSFYIKKFVYNNFANSVALIQMTVGDLAFYKNADDAQKRFAQLHAPARKPNVEACTPESEGHPSVRVSDGKLRVLMLSDFNGVKSNTLSNIKVAFDKIKSRENLSPIEREYYNNLQEFIVEGLKNIEVTDGQSFNTISSYRKKAIMMGDWNDSQERIYQKYIAGRNLRKDCKKRGLNHEQTLKELRNADLILSMSDIKTTFASVYKPFVFSKSKQQVGNGDLPINEMTVPIQLKNSEYTLMMADAIIQSEAGVSEDNLLGALIDSVEDTYYNADGEYMPDGIDTICFDSSCKSGGMTPLNINNFKDRETANKLINKNMFLNKPVTRHSIVEGSVIPDTQVEKYNSDTVRTMNFEDWGLQSDVTDHFRDHSQPESSQARAIIPSDLATIDENGNEIMYDLGNGEKGTARQFQEEYQRVHAENIQLSLMDLAEEFNISGTKAERNSAIAKILQKEVLANIGRYGIDMLQACTVDLNGDFRLPLTDPQQCQRVEQMLNSIIKNRVNKQEIAGGPVVQVTNFGTSKELNIRFKDAEGNLLPTRKEWEASNDGKYETYESYVKENQKSVAYFEVFAPIPSEGFEQFMDEEGNVDVKTIEDIDPDLLKVVGLRIPTEAKYSIIPMKIVGFMPRMAGEGIMMPADITWATGSDFDVDKMYLQRIDKNICRNTEKLSTAYIDKLARQQVDENIKSQIEKGTLPEGYQMSDNARTVQEEKAKEQIIKKHQKEFETHVKNQMLNDPEVSKVLKGKSETVKTNLLKDFIQHPTDRKYWSDKNFPDSLYNKLKHAYLKATITTKESDEARVKNNNQIVRMNYGILTHNQTIEEQLNPGNFELQKIYGYAMNAYRAGAGLPGKKNPTFQDYVNFGKSKEGGTDALKSLTDQANPRNLCDFSTNMLYYNSNQAAANLIGIFASQRVSHAQLSVLNNVQLRLRNLMNVDVNSDYRIGDYSVPVMQHIAATKCEITTERISKYFASLIGAAADAAKEPCLDALNINPNTINVFCTALRIGMPFETIAPLLSSQIMRDVNESINNSKLSDHPITMKKALEAKKVELIESYIESLHSDGNRSNIDYDSFRKQIYPGVKSHFEQLSKASVSTKDIMNALKDNNDFDLQYKILCAVERISNVANAYQKYDLTTKYNSINSAVGPWCTDNIIREKKMESLNDDTFGYVVKADDTDPSQLTAITPKELLAAMPINDQFSKAYDMAKKIMQDFPAYQENFQNMINAFEDMGMMNVLSSSRNRNLLKNLQNQIQTMSYMEKSGVDPKTLSEVRDNFPKVFETRKKQFFTKHPELKDNKLLQNIYTLLDKNDNAMVSLRWNTEYRREDMMNAWSDIYKVDKDFAMQMYYYCVSIGGLGWNKKTWLQYLPLDMKEDIKGYKESLKNTDLTTTKWQQLETFVLHNWKNCPSLVTNLVNNKANSIFDYIPSKDNNTLNASKYRSLTLPIVGEQCPLYVSTFRTKDDSTGEVLKDIYRFSHMEKDIRSQFYTPVYKKLSITDLGNKGEYMDLSYKADIPNSTLAYLNHDSALPIILSNGITTKESKNYARKNDYNQEDLQKRDAKMYEKQEQKSQQAIKKMKEDLANLDMELKERQSAEIHNDLEDSTTEFEPTKTELSEQQAKIYDDVTGNAPKADIPETASARLDSSEVAALLEQSGDTKGVDMNAVRETLNKNSKDNC